LPGLWQKLLSLLIDCGAYFFSFALTFFLNRFLSGSILSPLKITGITRSLGPGCEIAWERCAEFFRLLPLFAC
jgi:hypothetical protein